MIGAESANWNTCWHWIQIKKSRAVLVIIELQTGQFLNGLIGTAKERGMKMNANEWMKNEWMKKMSYLVNKFAHQCRNCLLINDSSLQ